MADLPATVVFDYPTPSALAAFCANQTAECSSPDERVAFPTRLDLKPAPASESAAMVIDACIGRFCSEKPEPVGDGFGLSVCPHSRWDADISVAAVRLGGRFGRC